MLDDLATTRSGHHARRTSGTRKKRHAKARDAGALAINERTYGRDHPEW